MKTYEGKRATAAWLNENAPVGTVILSRNNVELTRYHAGWSVKDSWKRILLGKHEDDYGYQIIQWGDPWDDLEWVDEE